MNNKKEFSREIVKQMSELSYNSQRILKWSNILSKKISESENFSGKDEIMKELDDEHTLRVAWLKTINTIGRV